ncbi:SMR family transporter [Photobacterium sp. 2_MG-2023]|uniref:SMR family transporter n=1 Tax=unclassified Photobacterium TaxID=2628852 RepID=UPI001C463CA7|nr:MULTISPECIES: SMR family transporter [unclassified Photobacterium]MBV7262304.1 QacE family quaternary ammonium compound efflux SMR transporter [Photobacterium sp. WH24]MDO6583691.1 SMR family transporter [Photobacterium sp. 2_MG-2023]
MFLARIFLLLAIASEVAGTSTMNLLGQQDALWGYAVMYLLITVSYYFLSLAAKRIAIGVAYAIWEGLGITLITLVSLLVFKADLNSQELLGLGLAVAGIVMVTLGEAQPDCRATQAKSSIPHSTSARSRS